MEHRASAATVSRKLSNGIYDGVFAAPTKSSAPKLSSPVQDYREIFGGGDASRASSIPLLDVPELRERKVSVDVRSSKLDYADIFGGFRDSDYAISLEELIAKPRKGRSSSNEARTPAYTPPDVSNPSKQAASYEAPCQSFGEVKQFNMLYQKTNVPTKNGTTGTTHIAQLHAVPGYTRLIDESTPLRKTQDDGPATSVGSDTHSKTHCVEGTIEGKCSQKSMSGLPPGATNKQTPLGSVKIQRKSTQNKSFSSDVLFDVNDFGLGTYSPQLQPTSGLSSNAGNSERGSKGPVGLNFRSSTFDATDAGASSPPYFGEEMDKNSVAAESAAAVKLAIEKAQARMRLAKELMERKKEGFQSREKLNFKDGLRTQKKRGEKIAVKANILQEEKVQEPCEQVNTTVELSDWMGKNDAMKAGQVALGSGDMKELATEEAIERMQTKGIKAAQADHMPGEMKEHEAEQYCELVRAVKHSAPALEVKQTNHVNERIPSPYEFDQEIGMANSTPAKSVDNNMKCKVDEEVHEREERVKKLNTCEGEQELEAHAATLMLPQQVHDQEGEKKLEVAQEREETEDVHVPREQDECDEKQETPKSIGVLENVEALELEENSSMRLEEAHERVEKGKKRGDDEDQEECTNGSENILEMVTDARRSDDTCGKEENGKKLDESCGSEENEMGPGEPCKWEENEYQQKDTDSGEKTEKSGDGNNKHEMIGEVFKKIDEGEESDEYFEDSKSEENERFEGEETDELNKTYQVEDGTRQEEICEWADTAEIWTEIDQREEDTVEAAQEAFKYDRNNLEAADGMCTHDEHEHWSTTKETCFLKEIDKDAEATSEAILYKGESIMKDTLSFESRDSEKGSESSVEGTNELDYNEIFDTSGVTNGALELDEMIEQMKEANDAFPFNANGTDLGKTEMKSGKKQNGQYAEESETVSNVEEHFNGLVHELRESNKSIKETELIISNGGNGNSSNSTYDERWVRGIEEEAAQQPSTSDRREKTGEIARESESSQSSERFKENQYETLVTEERESKYIGKKEVGPEREHIKKLDEAKERENIREKERIAVQRAIREARERAFAEARERAAMEKSTAGARQKPVTETRERLGKASVEANNQPSADKEAKLKAERAAVDRATAEARERALEKAKSGKAASDARNQAEKLYGGSRDDGMRQSFPSADSQNRASGPSHSSRSSNHGERSEGANSELAQRFKGEWERQQRTAERAAKALAEKNMRDLLVQKEQAERNRLAGSLDADIKRWSGGKERNLRALLSTLHYILGPESGWQPVPLTDIMATDAVKKTYRRATLFVHPDKLQQRGASIQQKYTCEKVFDLLKEAWDKFKREEQ